MNCYQRTCYVPLAVLVCAWCAGLSLAQEKPRVEAKPTDTVSRAMHDELARSMEKLRLAQLERPFFIAYHIAVLQ
jgi:hypothetical protein